MKGESLGLACEHHRARPKSLCRFYHVFPAVSERGRQEIETPSLVAHIIWVKGSNASVPAGAGVALKIVKNSKSNT